MKKKIYTVNKILLKKNGIVLTHSMKHATHTSHKKGGSVMAPFEKKPYRLMGTMVSYGSGVTAEPSSLTSNLSRLNFSNRKVKNVRLLQ